MMINTLPTVVINNAFPAKIMMFHALPAAMMSNVSLLS